MGPVFIFYRTLPKIGQNFSWAQFFLVHFRCSRWNPTQLSVKYAPTRDNWRVFTKQTIQFIVHQLNQLFELFQLFYEKLKFSTRLEIISDVVSERHVAEKFRYHIGNTDVVSEKTDVVSEKTDVVSVFPMWYRYFRLCTTFLFQENFHKCLKI